MFKEEKTYKLSDEQFSVGSLIISHNKSSYLVVPANSTSVRVLNLTTMLYMGEDIDVVDINFLSSNEVRKLTNNISFEDSMSDFSFNPKGLKGLKGEYV